MISESFHTSLERSLQTLAIGALFMLYLPSIIWSPLLIYYLIFKTKLWWLCSIYLFWIFFIDKDAHMLSRRRSEWFRTLKWFSYAKNYYPIKIIKGFSEDLQNSRNYLFCYFPHGIFGQGVLIGLCLDVVSFRKNFPNHIAHLHILTLNFFIPFMREMFIWAGVIPCSRKYLDYNMEAPQGGNVSMLVVGGAEEASYCNPGVHKIVLRRRKGFIKVALRNGCSLVPVYGFGENDTYGQYTFKENSLIWKLQKKFKKWTGVSLVFIRGRGFFQNSFGMLPRRFPINVVVGEPIDVEKVPNPTQQQIDELHQLFETKILELFESHKKYYLKDHETAHLEIV